MDISLITSLYRSEAHLPRYIEQVQRVSSQLRLSLEIVLVANDASASERALLEKLAQSGSLTVQLIYTERETLYASWNRGIAAAQAAVLGFWNVDDQRTVEGLAAGYQALSAGAQITDMAFEQVQDGQITLFKAPYQRHLLAPKTGVSPFFMFRRELYHSAGMFNPYFRIAGDYEWSKRMPVREAAYQPLAVVGGQFILHDGNLSGGIDRLEWVEFNIALIWHGGSDQLRPVDPDLMREVWETWGYRGGSITADTADWLWGDGAQERYQQYTRERQSHPLLRRIQLALAKRGLIRSTAWHPHLEGKD